MINQRIIVQFLREWLGFLFHVVRGNLMSRQALVIENVAMRSQLAIYEKDVLAHKRPKHRPTPAFRQLWIMFFKFCSHWESLLIVVKPATVIGWHRKAFGLYWARKSRPKGRPPVSRATIALIKRVHNENPLWSPERIHDQLINLGITDVPCPNTIAKYFPTIRKTPSEKAQQSWKTFFFCFFRTILI